MLEKIKRKIFPDIYNQLHLKDLEIKKLKAENTINVSCHRHEVQVFQKTIIDLQREIEYLKEFNTNKKLCETVCREEIKIKKIGRPRGSYKKKLKAKKKDKTQVQAI